TFAYDANNRRYKRTDGKQTVYYVGALELSKQNEGSDTFIKRYIGNDAVQQYYSTRAAKLQWLFTDHQGSIVAVTDSNYKLLARYKYDPFGKKRTLAFTSEERINQRVALHLTLSAFRHIEANLRGYTGHEPVSLDGDNRIIHMNGRIYDADTGRFMQADPVVQAPSNIQSYNAYSYVLNNPLSRID
ncbi:RHS repeat domain-containing protein, partial [Pseudoalteromonas rubra]